jgi:hypothetical protein
MLAFVLLGADASPAPVRITVNPSTVYIERSATRQSLQFDFVLQGETDDSLSLTGIRLTARDSTGRPWFFRFVDRSGSDPSIETVPRRVVPGREAIIVYNPFPVFPVGRPLHRLEYEFTFQRGEESSAVTVVVEPREYRQPFGLRIPLDGRVLVFEGHDFYSHHRRFNYEHPVLRKAGLRLNSGRYAHDLSLVDESGRMYRGDGKRNEDWLSWGMPIRAPASGKVVEVENGMPDYDVGRPDDGLSVDSILARPEALMGNHVVIDHGGGRFSRLFHMMRGSVTVTPGQTVTAGQVIGRVGFSGSVYTVHLHYEMGTGPGLNVDGLPAYFSGFRRVLGARMGAVERGPIDTGDIVSQP